MVVFGDGKKPSQGRTQALSFGEIVGQAEFKQALLVVAANDDIDGLLVSGEKGTAKSTAVRALRDLLPDQRAVADCPYGCHPKDADSQCEECRGREDPPVTERPVPLVTLPLGATRDRVVGTLSVGDALDGKSEFQPGLLARANRGILYVDEVNLLDDHLVDVLLDAAASGINRVERDGMSVSHPAEFTLVGTMNPEEGDLRPQLKDRFALQTTVTGCDDVDDRVAIIEQALDGPGEKRSVDGDAAQRLRTARDRLDAVALPDEFTEDIAHLCRDAGIDGHRGDIATARTARTLAALDERTKVIESDVRRAAELALPHRFQSRPFEDAPDPSETIADHFDDDEDGNTEDESGNRPDGDDNGDDETESSEPDGQDEPEGDRGGEGHAAGEPDEGHGDADRPTDESGERTDEHREQSASTGATGDESDGAEADSEQRDDGRETGDSADDADPATPLVPGQERVGIGESAAPDIDVTGAAEDGTDGARAQSRPNPDNDGPRVRTTVADGTSSIDAAASVRTAARRGSDRVETRDLRQSVRASDAGALVLFVVDASASMRPAMRTAKGTVLELLKDAYQQRDEVGFVAVAGDSADVVLPPTDSVTLAARHLKDLPTGDRTPLPDGLRTASEVIDRANPHSCVVVLVTDGKANVAEGSPTAKTRAAASALAEQGAHVVVVDASDGDRAGVTDIITDATDGDRIPLSALSAERLDVAVGDRR
ncbi:VWA domain-containing protein [Halorientalis brevis]|uniref:VWA domain-containing protein n=1 Tax=Halorientalis brevis TaxID=1126241 RepID=A0ABD6CFP2_9EURY|nr:VWA domain-containing protein [Halorientalis brevis]